MVKIYNAAYSAFPEDKRVIYVRCQWCDDKIYYVGNVVPEHTCSKVRQPRRRHESTKAIGLGRLF